MIERYASKEMTRIWSDENKINVWIQIQLALLKILKAVYSFDMDIPTVIIRGEGIDIEVGQDPNLKTSISLPVFINEWKDREAETHHDVVAFLNVLEEKIGDCGNYLHYGMTSSDLCDTELSIRIQQSLGLIVGALVGLREKLLDRAIEFRHTPIMGRTHGMYAEPTTFGLVLLIYVAELDRNLERLNSAVIANNVGKISGAVGTYAHITPEVEKLVLTNFSLNPPLVANQILQRDRHAELMNALALTGATLEKLAVQIRHLSRSEIGEVRFGDKQKGSSAMPHKKNPIRCENICGMARLLRGYASTAMENIALWHERDISHSSAERFILPDAFGVLYFMLQRMYKVIDGLECNTEIMASRVADNANLWRSQSLMLEAIKGGMSRKEAHDMAQRGELSESLQPLGLDYHLKHVDEIFKRF